MKKKKRLTAKTYWFWANLVDRVTFKTHKKPASSSAEIRTRLILIQAKNERSALEKAFRIGKSEQFNYKLDAKTATKRFLGLTGIGLIHDPLEDAVEITWNRLSIREFNQKRRILPKSRLLKQLKQEVAPIKRLTPAVLRRTKAALTKMDIRDNK